MYPLDDAIYTSDEDSRYEEKPKSEIIVTGESISKKELCNK